MERFSLFYGRKWRILWSNFRFFMEKIGEFYGAIFGFLRKKLENFMERFSVFYGKIGEFYGAIFAFLRKKKDFFMQKNRQKKG